MPKKKPETINNLIVISDTHCGCQLGLIAPRGIRRDEGGKYDANALQRKMWRWWVAFWEEWVPRVTRGEAFDLCINGDLIQGKKHPESNITSNLTIQREIAEDVLGEPCARAVRLYITRGTAAHDGDVGEEAEQLAKNLGAVKDGAGRHARFELWKHVGHRRRGPLCHIMHHVGTTGRQAYESSAPQAELVAEFAEAGARRNVPPDYVIRSHRHRYIKVDNPSERHEAAAIVTPGWQGKTPFAYRVAGGRISEPQFGGILIRHGDEEFYSRKFVHRPQRTKAE